MSERDHDIFTKRGITPPWAGGVIAEAQGFERYGGADWRERLERLTQIDARYGQGHPDPDSAYHRAREKVLHARLGPKSRAAEDYDGPTYDVAYLEIRPFAPIRERRSHKTQARLHFDATREAPDDVLEALAAIDPAEAARASWQGWLTSALNVDGWAMPRHAVMPADPKPLTQIRPDAPVNLGKGPAKYIYTPGRTAKRLGTNPLARELPTWDDPDALFVFVMEGTLKMCSVVEAGYPAIDAGSVTLWGGGSNQVGTWDDDPDDDSSWSGFVSELERFAGVHLGGRPVAVVCDSDWSTNADVMRQARKVTNVLNRAGARAVACAPPEGPPSGINDPLTGRPLREKRGIDDWLGEVLSLELGIEGLAPIEARHERLLHCVARPEQTRLPEMPDAEARLRAALDPQAVPSALAAVRDLASRADVDGYAPADAGEMAERIGVGRTTVWRSLKRAADAGVVRRVAESRPEHVNGQVRERAAIYHVPGAPPPRTLTLKAWLASGLK